MYFITFNIATMLQFYPFLKNTVRTILYSAALFTSATALAQATAPCGVVAENFNVASNGMAGFTSSVLMSSADGFVYNNKNGEGNLQACNIPNAGTVYEITTRTFTSLADQTYAGYGFELTGGVNVSSINVFLQYITADGEINTVKDLYPATLPTTYTGSGANSKLTICDSVNLNNIEGFTGGDRYRFVIQLTAATASQSNQCIFFDNFRTQGGPAQIVLPVGFMNINAKKVSSGVQITWSVAGEVNVNRYEIERSTNGRDFSVVGQVTAGGRAVYSFVDRQPATGVTFYRVRNVDVDGKHGYSTVVRLNLNAVAALHAYPQPARSSITIEHPTAVSGGAITLSSATGQVIQKVDVKADTNQTVLELSALHAGMYLVRFNDNQGTVQTVKIVKQ
jgi:hypothetical protein